MLDFKPERFKIWFEIEPNCNLSCKHCYCKESYNDDIDNRLIILADIIINSFNLDCITLTGGEPLLCKDLDRVVGTFSSHEIPVIIATNGTLLSRSRIIELIAHRVNTFQIPLLSASSHPHDYLTGKPSWNDIMTALLILKEYGCNVNIVFVATQFNLNEFINVLEIAAILRIRQVIFNKFIPGQGRGKQNNHSLGITNQNELIDVLHECIEFSNNNGIKIILGTPLGFDIKTYNRSVVGGQCSIRKGMNSFVIDYSGNVRLCPQSSSKLGNITKDGPINILKNITDEINMLEHDIPSHLCLLHEYQNKNS